MATHTFIGGLRYIPQCTKVCLVGGGVGLGHFVGEAASITAVALALLEGIAHTASGTARSSSFSVEVVGKAARIATVALATLEGIAHASSAAGGPTETSVVTVRESATTSAIALTLLESIAHTRGSAVGGEVGEGATVAVTVREAAVVTAIALTTLESITHASRLALESARKSTGTHVTTSHIVGEAARISAITLA